LTLWKHAIGRTLVIAFLTFVAMGIGSWVLGFVLGLIPWGIGFLLAGVVSGVVQAAAMAFMAGVAVRLYFVIRQRVEGDHVIDECKAKLAEIAAGAAAIEVPGLPAATGQQPPAGPGPGAPPSGVPQGAPGSYGQPAAP